MSFLDNLENNLKALESRDQGGMEDPKRRDLDRQKALASGPWAEQLKKGPFAASVMQLATRAGFQIRTKVNLHWQDATLRLEARGQRLELRPTSDGVIAVFLYGINETRREKVDLSKSPEPLVKQWIHVVEEQKRADEAAIAAIPEELE